MFIHKKPILFFSISTIFIILLFSSQTHLEKNPKTTPIHKLHIQNHIQIANSICHGTLYPQLCVSTLASFPNLSSKSLQQIISSTLNKTILDIHSSSSSCHGIRNKFRNLDSLQKIAISDCLELFDVTISELQTALSDLSSKNLSTTRYHDLQTVLSGAMTNQYTCLDGFAYSKGNVRDAIKMNLYNISRHVSNSLVILKKIPRTEPSPKNEVFPEYGTVAGGFPTWVSSKDRKLLQTSVNETKYNLVVAKDGTGNFTNISDAVAAAPNSSLTRFVIYIKAGAYFENVEVVSKQTMLMFVGDGIGKTVVKASRNVVDGWTTFRSATVA